MTTYKTRSCHFIIGVLLSVLVITGVAIAIWKTTSDDSDDHKTNNIPATDKMFSLSIGSNNVTLNLIPLPDVNTSRALPLTLAVGASTQSLILKDTDSWSSSGQVAMTWSDGTSVVINKSRDDHLLSCFTVNWTLVNSAIQSRIDCIDVSHSFWYGWFEESYQHWPISALVIPMSPFLTGDAFNKRDVGDVIDPLLVSSLGFGIYVEDTVPLYVSFNHQLPGHICLQARSGKGTPFFQNEEAKTPTPLHLSYHVCRSTDVTSLWKEMARVFISRPRDIPSPSMFRYPIWSTWAMYKANINQTTTISFAENILDHGFGISQLEIDDNWTPKYGDLTFDEKKFPDARAMVSALTAKRIVVTVWMHPFFNNDSHAFKELSDAGYLIKETTGQSPALTSWWRGDHAGILDVTNQKAIQWYLNKTDHLKSQFNVTSFKFDAGEVNWLPERYKVQNQMNNPNDYTRLYSQMAYHSDTKHRRQETRVGFKTQDLPIFVRMMDRASSWGHERGLKSLIPTALTFSTMGYHFILPDMIGGNAYDPHDIDRTVLPDAELFVRWLQVTTFMPTLQFSVAPWLYNDTILNISTKFVDLHESFSDKIISLAHMAVTTGEPIVRPLWWIAPHDSDALVLDSEFLLGDSILVAPVLERGARSRDIYLPKGRWKDALTLAVHTGPVWLRKYPAPIDVLPYFYNLLSYDNVYVTGTS